MSPDSRQKLLWCLLLAVVAGAAFWWLQGIPPVVANAPEAPARTAEDEGTVGADRPAVATPEREAAPAAPVVPASDASFAHVKGRCVDEAKRPLAGCTVKLHGFGANSNRVAMQGKVDWRNPEPVSGGDDGRFDIAFAPPSGFQFSLDVQAAKRVPRTGRWSGIQPGQTIDLGDITMAAGFEVRGRVVDERGAPVDKIGVSVKDLPLPITSGMGANDTRNGWSDANGSFTIQVPIPAGNWPIEASGRGWRHVSPTSVTVDPARGAEPLVVVVRAMPSISGIVVDELGQPVEGVGIEAELHRSGRMASGRSRKDGTFTIYAVDAEPKPVKLVVDDPGPCEPSWQDDRLWEWGSKDLRITLERALSFELTVVERESGKPVTRYAVSCHSERSRSSLQSDMRLSGEHPDGRVMVDKVWRGKTFLTVYPLDPELLPSATTELEATDAGAPAQRVELERLRRAVVRATTSSSIPVVGAKVEVIARGSTPLRRTDIVTNPRQGSYGHSGDPKYRFHSLLSSGVTDTTGRTTVFVPAVATNLVVRITTPDHPPAVVDPAIFVPDHELAVTVPDGGSVTGKVILIGLEPGLVTVFLKRPDGQQVHRMGTDVGRLDADGRFAFRGLDPGRYSLHVVYSPRFRTSNGSSSSQYFMPLQLPEVVVQPGGETDVTIDASGLQPSTVRGRVTIDGAPPAAARVFVSGQQAGFGQVAVAADGRFEVTGVMPGEYQLCLVVGDFVAAQGDTLMHEDTFRVTSGQDVQRDFAFVRRRLVVRLLQVDGKTPAANVQCWCNATGQPHLTGRRTTDAEGRLVLDPAPSGAVFVQPLPGQKALGPVEIPAGRKEHEVTLTLPPPQGT